MQYVFTRDPKNHRLIDGYRRAPGKNRTIERRRVKIWMSTNGSRAETKPAGHDPTPAELLPGSHCIINLSPHGAYIAGQPLRQNTMLQMQFVLPNRFNPVRLQGRVIWSRAPSEGSISSLPGMGIHFSAISDDDQAAISTYLYGSGSGLAAVEEPAEVKTKNAPAPLKLSALADLTDQEIDHFLALGLKGNASSPQE